MPARFSAERLRTCTFELHELRRGVHQSCTPKATRPASNSQRIRYRYRVSLGIFSRRLRVLISRISWTEKRGI